jgi:uncharacterized membrane protein
LAGLRGFFSEEDEQAILAAIRQAEARTSGEIRVRVEARSGDDPLAAARAAFESLGMRATELHNGVLFYLAVEDKTFVILGDDGIDAKVPKDFWDTVRDTVIDGLRQGAFGAGLAAGIERAGEQLAAYFPCAEDDANELPDAISYGDEGAA